MVPRMRTVGVCCAEADETRMQVVKAATTARGIQLVSVGMACPSRHVAAITRQTPRNRRYSVSS
jgi:hypothetical protein